MFDCAIALCEVAGAIKSAVDTLMHDLVEGILAVRTLPPQIIGYGKMSPRI